MRYFYTDADRQPRGPEEREKILELLSSGVINSASLVAAEGSSSWHPISSLSAGDSAPPLTVSQRTTEPLAIVSLSLSVAGIFLCGVCGIGFLLGVAGIVCGHWARGKIRRNANLDGDGLALAGLIVSYITVSVFLIYILIYAGFIGWGMADGFKTGKFK